MNPLSHSTTQWHSVGALTLGAALFLGGCASAEEPASPAKATVTAAETANEAAPQCIALGAGSYTSAYYVGKDLFRWSDAIYAGQNTRTTAYYSGGCVDGKPTGSVVQVVDGIENYIQPPATAASALDPISHSPLMTFFAYRCEIVGPQQINCIKS